MRRFFVGDALHVFGLSVGPPAGGSSSGGGGGAFGEAQLTRLSVESNRVKKVVVRKLPYLSADSVLHLSQDSLLVIGYVSTIPTESKTQGKGGEVPSETANVEAPSLQFFLIPLSGWGPGGVVCQTGPAHLAITVPMSRMRVALDRKGDLLLIGLGENQKKRIGKTSDPKGNADETGESSPPNEEGEQKSKKPLVWIGYEFALSSTGLPSKIVASFILQSAAQETESSEEKLPTLSQVHSVALVELPGIPKAAPSSDANADEGADGEGSECEVTSPAKRREPQPPQTPQYGLAILGQSASGTDGVWLATSSSPTSEKSKSSSAPSKKEESRKDKSAAAPTSLTYSLVANKILKRSQPGVASWISADRGKSTIHVHSLLSSGETRCDDLRVDVPADDTDDGEASKGGSAKETPLKWRLVKSTAKKGFVGSLPWPASETLGALSLGGTPGSWIAFGSSGFATASAKLTEVPADEKAKGGEETEDEAEESKWKLVRVGSSGKGDQSTPGEGDASPSPPPPRGASAALIPSSPSAARGEGRRSAAPNRPTAVRVVNVSKNDLSVAASTSSSAASRMLIHVLPHTSTTGCKVNLVSSKEAAPASSSVVGDNPFVPATVHVEGLHPHNSQVKIESSAGPMDVVVKATYCTNADDTVVNLEWIDPLRLVAVKFEQHVFLGEERKQIYKRRFQELEAAFERLQEEDNAVKAREHRHTENVEQLRLDREKLENDREALQKERQQLAKDRELQQQETVKIAKEKADAAQMKDHARELELEADKRLRAEKDKARQAEREAEAQRKKEEKALTALNQEKEQYVMKQHELQREVDRIGREREQFKRDAAWAKEKEDSWNQERASTERNTARLKQELKEALEQVEKLNFEKKEMKAVELKLQEELSQKQRKIELLMGRGPTETDGEWAKRQDGLARMDEMASRGRLTTVGLTVDLNGGTGSASMSINSPTGTNPLLTTPMGAVAFVLGHQKPVNLFPKALAAIAEKDCQLKSDASFIEIEIGEGFAVGDHLMLVNPTPTLISPSLMIHLSSSVNSPTGPLTAHGGSGSTGNLQQGSLMWTGARDEADKMYLLNAKGKPLVSAFWTPGNEGIRFEFLTSSSSSSTAAPGSISPTTQSVQRPSDAGTSSAASSVEETPSVLLSAILQSIAFYCEGKSVLHYGARRVEGQIQLTTAKQLIHLPFRYDVFVVLPPMEAFRDQEPYIERTKGAALFGHYRSQNPFSQQVQAGIASKWIELQSSHGVKGFVGGSGAANEKSSNSPPQRSLSPTPTGATPSSSAPHSSLASRYALGLPKRCVTCNQCRSVLDRVPTLIDEKEVTLGATCEIRLSKLQLEDRLFVEEGVQTQFQKLIRFTLQNEGETVKLTCLDSQVTRLQWHQAMQGVSFTSEGIPLDDTPRRVDVTVNLPHFLYPLRWETSLFLKVINAAHEVVLRSPIDSIPYRPHLVGVGPPVDPPVLHFAASFIVEDKLQSKFGGTVTFVLQPPFSPDKDHLRWEPNPAYGTSLRVGNAVSPPSLLLTQSGATPSGGGGRKPTAGVSPPQQSPLTGKTPGGSNPADGTARGDGVSTTVTAFEVLLDDTRIGVVEQFEDGSKLILHLSKKSTISTAQALIRSVGFSTEESYSDGAVKKIRVSAALGKGSAQDFKVTVQLSAPLLSLLKLGSLKWTENQGSTVVGSPFGFTDLAAVHSAATMGNVNSHQQPSSPHSPSSPGKGKVVYSQFEPAFVLHFSVSQGAESGDKIFLDSLPADANPDAAQAKAADENDADRFVVDHFSVVDAENIELVTHLHPNATAYTLKDGSFVLRVGPAQDRNQLVTLTKDDHSAGGGQSPDRGAEISTDVLLGWLGRIYFHHLSKDPKNLKKVLCVRCAEYGGTCSSAFVGLNVVPVDDPTEIYDIPRVAVFCQGSAASLYGFPLVPKARLHDPDTEDFIGGTLSVEPDLSATNASLGGFCPGRGDFLTFLTPEQQLQQYRRFGDAAGSGSGRPNNLVFLDDADRIHVFDDVSDLRSWEEGVRNRISRGTGSVDAIWAKCVGQLLREQVEAPPSPSNALGELVLQSTANFDAQGKVLSSSSANPLSAERWTISFTPKVPQLIPLEKVQAVLRSIAFGNESTRMPLNERHFVIRLGAAALCAANKVDDAEVADVTECKTTLQMVPATLFVPSFRGTASYQRGSGAQNVLRGVSVLPFNPTLSVARSWLLISLVGDCTEDDSLGIAIKKEPGVVIEVNGTTLLAKKIPVATITASRRELRVDFANDAAGKVDAKILQSLIRSVTYNNRTDSTYRGTRDVSVEYHCDFLLPSVSVQIEEIPEDENVKVQGASLTKVPSSTENSPSRPDADHPLASTPKQSDAAKSDPAPTPVAAPVQETPPSATAEGQPAVAEGATKPEEAAAAEPEDEYSTNEFEDENSPKKEKETTGASATEDSGNATAAEQQPNAVITAPTGGESTAAAPSEPVAPTAEGASEPTPKVVEEEIKEEVSPPEPQHPPQAAAAAAEPPADTGAATPAATTSAAPTPLVAPLSATTPLPTTRQEKGILRPGSYFQITMTIELAGAIKESEKLVKRRRPAEVAALPIPFVAGSGASFIFRDVEIIGVKSATSGVMGLDTGSQAPLLCRPGSTLQVTVPPGISLTFTPPISMTTEGFTVNAPGAGKSGAEDGYRIRSNGIQIATLWNPSPKISPGAYRFDLGPLCPVETATELLHQLSYNGSKKDKAGSKFNFRITYSVGATPPAAPSVSSTGGSSNNNSNALSTSASVSNFGTAAGTSSPQGGTIEAALSDSVDLCIQIVPPFIDDPGSVPAQFNVEDAAGVKPLGNIRIRSAAHFAGGSINIDLIAAAAEDRLTELEQLQWLPSERFILIPTESFGGRLTIGYRTDGSGTGGGSPTSAEGPSGSVVGARPFANLTCSGQSISVVITSLEAGGAVPSPSNAPGGSAPLSWINAEIVQEFLRTCIGLTQQARPAQSASGAEGQELSSEPSILISPSHGGGNSSLHDPNVRFSVSVTLSDAEGASSAAQFPVVGMAPTSKMKKAKSMRKAVG